MIHYRYNNCPVFVRFERLSEAILDDQQRLYYRALEAIADLAALIATNLYAVVEGSYLK